MGPSKRNLANNPISQPSSEWNFRNPANFTWRIEKVLCHLRGLYYMLPWSRGVRVFEDCIGHAWVAAGRLGGFFSFVPSRAGHLLAALKVLFVSFLWRVKDIHKKSKDFKRIFAEVKEAGGVEEEGISAQSSNLRAQMLEVGAHRTEYVSRGPIWGRLRNWFLSRNFLRSYYIFYITYFFNICSILWMGIMMFKWFLIFL